MSSPLKWAGHEGRTEGWMRLEWRVKGAEEDRD